MILLGPVTLGPEEQGWARPRANDDCPGAVDVKRALCLYWLPLPALLASKFLGSKAGWQKASKLCRGSKQAPPRQQASPTPTRAREARGMAAEEPQAEKAAETDARGADGDA